MATLHIADADILFYCCGFFFFFLAYSQWPQIGCLSYFHTWGSHSANLESRSEMCCTQLTENTGCKNYAKNRHLGTIAQLCQAISSQLRHILTIGKKLVKQQYLLHMSSQYGECQPTHGWDQLVSFGHPANFNGFRILASLLHRRRSTEFNQTLHNVWPSLGLVLYLYIFGRGRCTHRTSKIGNIGACWNIGESASANRRCRCCQK